jgi:hypothetical protein
MTTCPLCGEKEHQGKPCYADWREEWVYDWGEQEFYKWYRDYLLKQPITRWPDTHL